MHLALIMACVSCLTCSVSVSLPHFESRNAVSKSYDAPTYRQNTDICRMWFVFYHPGENVLRSHPKWRRYIYLSRLFSLPSRSRPRPAAKGRTHYSAPPVRDFDPIQQTIQEICGKYRFRMADVGGCPSSCWFRNGWGSITRRGGTQSGTGLRDDGADVAVRPTDQCHNAKIPFLPSFLPSILRVRCNADGFSSIARCVTWNLNSMPSAYDYVLALLHCRPC